MKVLYSTGCKTANIGDVIITDKGHEYILLKNLTDNQYPIAIWDVTKDCIKATTRQEVFCVDGTLVDETIQEIIPKLRVKIVIE